MSPQSVSISAGDLELDLGRRLLLKSGKVVRLAPTEFNLLAFLMKNQGVPLTHAKLLRTIWGPEYGEELEYLRSYVRSLRKKIENDPAHPRYLVTEPWLGYRFCSPSKSTLVSLKLWVTLRIRHLPKIKRARICCSAEVTLLAAFHIASCELDTLSFKSLINAIESLRASLCAFYESFMRFSRVDSYASRTVTRSE